MKPNAYRAKRTLMSPLIARRRKAMGPQPPIVERLMTHAGYSKAMWEFLSVAGIDIDFIYRADLDETSTVLDVGSFEGETVDRFCQLYDCNVHAFEPHPGLLPRLVARFSSNPKVTVHAVGLGDSDAEVPLQLAGPGSTMYETVGDVDGTSQVAIRDAVAVLGELGLDRIDLLKLNIEGAEFDLLDHLIANGRLGQVRYLLVQFHEWHPRAYYRRWAIRRTLRKTHDEVWCFPWVWEMWCLRSEPHPVSPEEWVRGLLAEREAI